jgi:hypothetical protein
VPVHAVRATIAVHANEVSRRIAARKIGVEFVEGVPDSEHTRRYLLVGIDGECGAGCDTHDCDLAHLTCSWDGRNENRVNIQLNEKKR